MKPLEIGLASLAVLLMITSASFAQDTKAAKACAADIKSLCAGVQPGEGRVKVCITSNFTKLSAGCQTVLHAAAAIRSECKPDVTKFCANVQPGGGRIGACMKSHAADLSSACKESLAEATAGKS